MKDRFDKAEGVVWEALKQWKETRGNDMHLIRMVWELQGFRLPNEKVSFFYKLINPETITRCRRKIQAGGMFLPEPFKVAERTLFAMKARDKFRKMGEKFKKK